MSCSFVIMRKKSLSHQPLPSDLLELLHRKNLSVSTLKYTDLRLIRQRLIELGHPSDNVEGWIKHLNNMRRANRGKNT